MEIDPESLPVDRRYALMIGAIVPRPIAVVGTCDPAGRPNLAPFSFFTGVGSEPMGLVVSVANPPGGAGGREGDDGHCLGAGFSGAVVGSVADDHPTDAAAAGADGHPRATG